MQDLPDHVNILLPKPQRNGGAVHAQPHVDRGGAPGPPRQRRVRRQQAASRAGVGGAPAHHVRRFDGASQHSIQEHGKKLTP